VLELLLGALLRVELPTVELGGALRVSLATTSFCSAPYARTPLELDVDVEGVGDG